MMSPGVRTASNASQATSPGASGTNASHLATSPGVELFTQSGGRLPSILRNGPCPAPRDVASASASAPRPFHRSGSGGIALLRVGMDLEYQREHSVIPTPP